MLVGSPADPAGRRRKSSGSCWRASRRGGTHVWRSNPPHSLRRMPHTSGTPNDVGGSKWLPASGAGKPIPSKTRFGTQSNMRSTNPCGRVPQGSDWVTAGSRSRRGARSDLSRAEDRYFSPRSSTRRWPVNDDDGRRCFWHNEAKKDQGCPRNRTCALLNSEGWSRGRARRCRVRPCRGALRSKRPCCEGRCEPARSRA